MATDSSSFCSGVIFLQLGGKPLGQRIQAFADSKKPDSRANRAQKTSFHHARLKNEEL